MIAEKLHGQFAEMTISYNPYLLEDHVIWIKEESVIYVRDAESEKRFVSAMNQLEVTIIQKYDDDFLTIMGIIALDPSPKN